MEGGFAIVSQQVLLMKPSSRIALEKCQLKATVSSLPNLLDSHGQLVEYEEPSKLLDTNSYFSKLVAESWSSGKNREPDAQNVTHHKSI
ncbi:unnamed protein product [Prunus armeniaca]|uniref:Uncharacterized protein n=1 Tax=Prunus armeniaca TaxID=36596 RepID=A0A6J5WMB5_PRUAR|nr:unnamed protein product [Prunus armeniaca]